MSDEAMPDVTWEEVADSLRLDDLVEGRMRPTTSEDVLTLMKRSGHCVAGGR
ncbi:hypothetical protein ACFY2J_27145 [Streptomyces collinus]|uniref:hypothetical protein n=1 Tax=Streptomyces collinus TaxID=42684 RepID=UPI0036755357